VGDIVKKILNTSLLFLVCGLSLPLGLAKGLDELKPDAEPTTTPSGDPAPAPAPAAGEGTPAAADVVAQPTAAPTPVPEAAAAAVAVEKPVEPSATSKRLANRLALGVGLGVIKILAAKEGEWNSNGLADVQLTWRLLGEPGAKFGLATTFRYTPIETDTVIDDQSYRGVIDGYHLGTAMSFGAGKSFDILTSLEVGYLLVYLSSIDNFDVQEDSESNKLAFTLGLGGDWLAHEKIKFGPRLYYGIGEFQTCQFSVATSLVF